MTIDLEEVARSERAPYAPPNRSVKTVVDLRLWGMAVKNTELNIGGQLVTLPEVSRAVQAAGLRVTQDKFSPAFLQPLKLKIKTLVDVGVHLGTPDLYASFPTAKMVLVEPLPDSEGPVRAKFDHLYDIDFHNCAAGSEPGTMQLAHNGAGSSLLESHRGAENDPRFAGRIDVDIKTLDDILADYQGPFGLKVDTEGFELETLKGAVKTLQNTVFVIAEVGVRPRFANSYTFAEIVGWLDAHGFAFLAVLNDKPGMNLFYDCMFIRKDHAIMQPKTAEKS